MATEGRLDEDVEPPAGDDGGDDSCLNFLHFDPWLTSRGPALAALSTHLFPLLPLPRITEGRKPRGDAMRRREVCLSALVANLFIARCRGASGISLHIRAEKRTRYNRQAFTNEVLAWGVTALTAAGFTEAVKGSKSTGNTTLSPTSALEDLYAAFGVTMENVGRIAGAETILLKERSTGKDSLGRPTSSSVLIDYPDTEETYRLRSEMDAINEWLNAQDLRIGGNPFGPFHLVRMFQVAAEPTRKARPEFRQHGRIYRGLWQSMKKSERGSLSFGEEPLVELDFKGCFASLAYIEVSGGLPTGDPYAIPGLEGNRDEVKQLFNSILSRTKQPERLPQGLASRLPAGWTMKRFVTAFGERHPLLIPLVGSGAGLGLMFKESSIMIKLLLTLRKMGCPALPIHDCVLCRATDKDRVRAAMEETSREVLGTALMVVEK